jgi:hypothetical protein
MDMDNKPIARSVKNLQNLYTVVIGLSLATGIQQIIDFSNSGFPIHFSMLPQFFAYLALVVPVYHGAMRHLDIAHIENEGKPLALVFDFFILFIEGCFFLLLAGLVPLLHKFFFVLLSLLIIDVIWAAIANFGFANSKDDQKATRTWGLMNLITCGLLVLVYLYCDSLDSSKPADYYLKISIMVIVVIRSVIDYCLCWNLYYPKKDAKK